MRLQLSAQSFSVWKVLLTHHLLSSKSHSILEVAPSPCSELMSLLSCASSIMAPMILEAQCGRASGSFESLYS